MGAYKSKGGGSMPTSGTGQLLNLLPLFSVWIYVWLVLLWDIIRWETVE